MLPSDSSIPRQAADVGEGSVAVVEEQAASLGGDLAAADVEVEKAVPGRRPPQAAPTMVRSPATPEAAVMSAKVPSSPVAVEPGRGGSPRTAAAGAGEEEVLEAVVVDVPRHGGAAAAAVGDPRPGGDVGEGAVPEVAEQGRLLCEVPRATNRSRRPSRSKSNQAAPFQPMSRERSDGWSRPAGWPRRPSKKRAPAAPAPAGDGCQEGGRQRRCQASMQTSVSAGVGTAPARLCICACAVEQTGAPKRPVRKAPELVAGDSGSGRQQCSEPVRSGGLIHEESRARAPDPESLCAGRIAPGRGLPLQKSSKGVDLPPQPPELHRLGGVDGGLVYDLDAAGERLEPGAEVGGRLDTEVAHPAGVEGQRLAQGGVERLLALADEEDVHPVLDDVRARPHENRRARRCGARGR